MWFLDDTTKGDKGMLKLVIFSTLIFSQLLWGQASSELKLEKKQLVQSLSVSVSDNINLSEERELSSNYVYQLSYPWKDYKLGMKLSMDQGLSKPASETPKSDFLFYDPEMSISSSTKLLGEDHNITFKFIPALTRTSNQATKRFTLAFSVSRKLDFQKVSLIYALSSSYRNFAYEITKDGSINSPIANGAVLSLMHQLNSKWSVIGSMAYQNTISFQSVLRSYTSSEVGVNYAKSENMEFSLSLGSAKNSTLATNGQDQVIEIFDVGSAYIQAASSIQF